MEKEAPHLPEIRLRVFHLFVLAKHSMKDHHSIPKGDMIKLVMSYTNSMTVAEDTLSIV